MMSTALLTRSWAARPAGSKPRPTPHPDPRLQRWGALDGLRALAVVAVMLYHAGVSWIPGGLLGVDVFFVLSGFLITSLLLREVRAGGSVDLRAFWARRARRLLPALLLVLIAVSLWAALDKAQDIRSIRLDVTAALGYVANWRFAYSNQGYFASTQTPSPVLHLWSLGVEEQFYLVWPLLVAGFVAAARLVLGHRPRGTAAPRRVGDGRAVVLVISLVGAAASATWLIIGALNGTNSSRLYYGTDTRALALLTGAALAGLAPLPRSPAAAPAGVRATRFWTAAGAVALGGLGWIVASVSGQDRLLYRGGFLVVAMLVAVVIAALTRAPRGPLSRLLGLPPLTHVGRISYGLYLWHWPVVLFATAARTGLTGGALLGARLVAALMLAELSYWLLERPVLAGIFPARRVAAAGLLGVVAAAGITGPWLAVPRGAESADRAAFASRLDVLARRQEQRSVALSRKASAPLPRPTPVVVEPPPPPLPGGVPAQPPNVVPAEPLNALIVGDSTALAAAVAVEDQTTVWKVNVVDAARIGCGIAPGTGAGDGDQAPVSYGQCWDWPQRWADTVAVQRPDVSLLMVGRWEVVNRNVDGKVMHVGQPAYDKLMRAEFERAVSVLGSQGGKVALATAPCFQRPERPDGSRWPQDDCRRVQAFNRIVWSVAAAHSANVVVLDLYQFFSPDGRWHLSIGGHQVRDLDGLHYNIHGGKYLAPVFLGDLRVLMGLPLIPQPPPHVALTPLTGG
jgi:peptidoglycan/LPS O-acetylase OafA/YrhL